MQCNFHKLNERKKYSETAGCVLIEHKMNIVKEKSKNMENHIWCFEPVHPKGNQSWVFIGRTEVEAETPIFSPPDTKSWLIWKDPDVGKDWRQEKGTTEDEMLGWHHQLNGHEFEWTPGVGDGTGRPGMLRFMGSRRVGHDWATELNWDSYSVLKKKQKTPNRGSCSQTTSAKQD